MKQVEKSNYIAATRKPAEKLLKLLLDKYAYASILVTDCKEKNYRVSRNGMQVGSSDDFGGKGAVIKVYDGAGYAEYSTNELTEDNVDNIVKLISEELMPLSAKLPAGTLEAKYKQLADEEVTFSKSTEYEVHPDELGDEAICEKINDLRGKIIASDERIIDGMAGYNYQEYHKLFLSKNKDLEQNVLWSCGVLLAIAPKGEEVKDSYKGFSVLGGTELLESMEQYIPTVVKNVTDLLGCEPMVPGTYQCVCSPEVTGMIVHEAFGHGVEMDMFVKDRALAASFMGKKVASELVTMHDGNSVNEVATYFFDDEGIVSHDTVVIDKGILVAGFSDAQTAMHLGTTPTGNGRRESYERKAYTRMTNTYFEPGTDSVEDMIKSIDYGMLLDEPSSGMEDPKNWGIQCMVSFAREIKDGKLTGRIFSPIVLSGYVPDLLKSISMMSPDLELGGSGACGKGSKEWVKVSDGGPWIKAEIRLG